MFDLKLNIYYKLNDHTLADQLQNLSLIKDVKCQWNMISETSDFILPDNLYSLILTDDPAFISKISSKYNYIYIVYTGPLDGSSDFVDIADRIWSGYDNSLILKRFPRLIEDLHKYYEYHLYKSSLETMMDASPDMVWIKRIDGLHLAVNDKFTKTVGRSKEDCYMKTHEYIWNVKKEDVVDGVICIDSENEVISHDKLMMFEETVQLNDCIKQLNTYKSPIHDTFGNIIATCGIGRDMTDFNNMGLEMSIFIENTPLPVLMCDANYKIIRMNENFKKLTGLEPQQLAHLDYIEWKNTMLTAISVPEKREGMHSVQQEFKYRTKNSEISFILIEQEIINFFGDISGYYCLFMDITLRRKYEAVLLEAATVDALTGVYNRRYFYEYITKHKNSPMTILYIDLDRFKEVNDTFGHARGDDVLKKTAEYLKEIFHNDIVARIGGDEFTVLHIGQCDSSKLEEKGKLLNRKIHSIFRHEGIFVSASIGIAETDGVDLDIDAFIQEGDKKMYEIKKKHHEANFDDVQ